MGLCEGPAKRFAGEAHLLGRVLDQFAFAGGHEVDGAPHPGGDAQLLVDRFGRRAGFDGGERAGCWCSVCHPRNVACSRRVATCRYMTPERILISRVVLFGCNPSPATPRCRPALGAIFPTDHRAWRAGLSVTLPSPANGLLRYAIRA